MKAIKTISQSTRKHSSIELVRAASLLSREIEDLGKLPASEALEVEIGRLCEARDDLKAMALFKAKVENAEALCVQLCELAPKLRPTVRDARLLMVADIRENLEDVTVLHGREIKVWGQGHGHPIEFKTIDMEDVVERHIDMLENQIRDDQSRLEATA